MTTLEQNIEKLEHYLAPYREQGVLNQIGGEARPALSGATFLIALTEAAALLLT